MDIRNLMCTHYWILGYPDMDEDEKKSKNRLLGKFSVFDYPFDYFHSVRSSACGNLGTRQEIANRLLTRRF